MARCLVVYGSKYGATREVAEAIAAGLGADVSSVNSHPDLAAYELIVIGSPIYAGDYLAEVARFVDEHRPILKGKRVATFITAAADMRVPRGLTGEEDEEFYTQQHYADGLANLADGKVLATRGFGGRLRPEELDAHDHSMLSWFYHFLMHEDFKGFDLLDLNEARRWGQQLKQQLES